MTLMYLHRDYQQFLRTKASSIYYTFYFLDNLHICTADVKHYNSNSCKCADGVQMVAEEKGQSKEDRAKREEHRGKSKEGRAKSKEERAESKG